jgi:hypothetical protein
MPETLRAARPGCGLLACSPLRRARQTAQIVSVRLNLICARLDACVALPALWEGRKRAASASRASAALELSSLRHPRKHALTRGDASQRAALAGSLDVIKRSTRPVSYGRCPAAPYARPE